MPIIEFTSRNSSLNRAASSLIRAALLCLLLWQTAAPVFAHPVPFSYLDLRLGGGRLEGTLVAPISNLAQDLKVTPAETLLDPAQAGSKRDAIQALLRSRLQFAADDRALDLELLGIEPLAERQALSLRLSLNPNTGLNAAPNLLRIQCALFPAEPEHQTFLNVYEGEQLVYQEIFTKDHTALDYYPGGRQVVLAVVKKFIPGGIYHIFTGPDHILFLVGLLLLGGSVLRLLTIVTAFTIAHSITLSLAALDLVNPPSRLIEPAIALTLVFVGIDNLMVGTKGRDVRAWVAFFFGLVHGFGFAGVLREFGLPRQALGWSLFAFNFGVEIGQACIVVVVALLLAALRTRNQELGRRVTMVGSVFVTLAGGYWFVERVFF